MYKVLIVDDEKIVRIALKTMIKWEEYGFWVSGSVGDGAEAITFAEKTPPDVIITDLKMPNLDGIELIKRLKQNEYNGKVIVLSNYDDFEYVKQALKLGATDYVLKITLNQELLVTVLSALKEQLDKEVKTNETINDMNGVELKEQDLSKSNFFRDLFKEERCNEKYIVERASKIGLPLFLQESIILYLFIEAYDSYFENLNNKEREILTKSIVNTLEENFNNFTDTEIISIDYKRIAVIVPKENLIKNKMKDYSLAEKILKSIKQYLNIQANIIITNEFTSYIDARRSYDKCINTENMVFYGHESDVIKLDHNEGVSIEISFETKKVLDTFIKLFEIGSLEEIMEEIDKLFELSKQRNYQPIEVKKYILKLMEGTEKYIGNEFEDFDGIAGRYNDELIFCENCDNCKATISKFFNELYNAYKIRKGKKFKREIITIIEYLNRHISEKVTLEMISEHVNMNGSYLCRIFKKETNQSIFSYLTDLRIDKATNILKSKDSTIKELAAMVGIEDQFYFNRVFKKKLGISPTEFRKKYFETLRERAD